MLDALHAWVSRRIAFIILASIVLVGHFDANWMGL